MAQTTVQVQPGQITDLYAASGIDPAKTLVIQNIGSHEFVLSENSDMDGGMFLFPRSEPWENIIPGSAYVLSSNPALISVSSDSFKPVTQIGEKIPIGAFSGTRAITVQNYVEANVKNGVQFYTHFAYPIGNDIAAGASKYFLFVTGTTHVLFKNRIVNCLGEEFAHEIFSNPTVTDNGTPLSVGNYGGADAVATTVTCYKDATVSADGTAADDEPEYYFGGSAASGRSQIAFSEGIERKLLTNTTYLVKITNNGAQAGRFQWYGTWYEGGVDLPRPAGELG